MLINLKIKMIFFLIICTVAFTNCNTDNYDKAELSFGLFFKKLSMQSSPQDVKKLFTERELKLLKVDNMGKMRMDFYSGGKFFNHDIHNLLAQFYEGKLYFLQFQLLSLDSELNELYLDFIKIVTTDYGEPELSNDKHTKWKFEQETQREVTLNISLSPQTQKVILIYIRYHNYESIE